MQPMWRQASRFLILAGMLLPLLAVAGAPERGGQGDRERGHEVAPGTLIVPGRDQPSGKRAEDQRCMKVCIRWGEDCIIDNRGVRRCQRSCQEFGEQCF